MPTWRSLPVLLTSLALWTTAAAAQRPENAVALQRAAFASGGTANAAAASTRISLGQPVAGPADSPDATLHAGMHAPPVDRFGPILQARVAQFLLGATQQLDLLAVDAGGNHDGRVDVADLVLWVLRGLQ